MNYTIKLIRGHQDDYHSYNDLPVKSQLNVDADKTATYNESLPINTRLLSLPFGIYINHQYIDHNIDNNI